VRFPPQNLLNFKIKLGSRGLTDFNKAMVDSSGNPFSNIIALGYSGLLNSHLPVCLGKRRLPEPAFNVKSPPVVNCISSGLSSI